MRARSLRGVVGTLISLAACLALSASVRADVVSADCNTCYDMYFQHQFIGRGCEYGYMRCMDCHSFNACHPDLQPDYCTNFHWYCSGSVAAADVLKAVEGNDFARLATLVRERPEVTWNEARGAVQVTDCRGAVVANIPISAPLLSAVE
ncbi:MAG TPA: hypothetical protein VFQ39_17675 [Longimicrobium sp.]|nr:hypothetical protein [Longimicrobium sp.]